VDACVICRPVLSDAGSAINAFSLLLEHLMTITGRCLCGQSLGKLCAPVVTRVAGAGMPVSRAGSGTVIPAPHSNVHGDGPDSDYPSVADSGNQMHRRFCPSCGTPLSASRGASSLIFVASALSTTQSRHSCDDDLDVVCTRWACIDTELPQVVNNAAGGVMSDA